MASRGSEIITELSHSVANERLDVEYLDLLIEPLRVSKEYRPKFGRGRKVGLEYRDFASLYQKDSFYAWFGLDDPLMYAAHRAAGGMSSIYRQLGIAVERLFRRVLMDSLSLLEEDVVWFYEVEAASGRRRKLHLDGRVPLHSIVDDSDRIRFHQWMSEVANDIQMDAGVFGSLKGVVFEVRQGYKSRDSKRQNADISNASAAYANGYMPCAVILSGQIDSTVLTRYRAARWAVLTGASAQGSVLNSTYDFLREVIGYDLAAFFDRNSNVLRQEMRLVLTHLLDSP